MTELEALAKDCIENHTHRLVDKPTKQDIYLREESIFIQGYRQSEKQITKLEEQISVLLSCKNCPDNKGGYICQKEYEDKCLAQKIQYIKELQEENAELKELIEKYRQAVDKCLHITFMGGGCEVNTIGQYATLVDGYLTDVEGLAKWKD